MNNLVTTVIKSLVDNENSVDVKEVKGQNTYILEVSVDKEDIGKVIGKNGRTATAIRTLLKAASKKYKKRYILNIL